MHQPVTGQAFKEVRLIGDDVARANLLIQHLLNIAILFCK
jgi:hypothetical protein